MLRFIRCSATSLAVVLVLAWGAVWIARANPGSRAAGLVQAMSAWLRPGAPLMDLGLGGPFNLVDSTGHPVTDQTYRGKWMLIYFGYTYCPDVCPGTLQRISNVLDQLGDKAAQIVPIFITVDPERDTPAAIGQYVALFDPRFVGLSGTPEQVAAAAAAYRVYTRRVNSPKSGAYMIDHSSYTYLTGADGKLKALFQDGITDTDMIIAITAAISQRG